MDFWIRRTRLTIRERSISYPLSGLSSESQCSGCFSFGGSMRSAECPCGCFVLGTHLFAATTNTTQCPLDSGDSFTHTQRRFYWAVRERAWNDIGYLPRRINAAFVPRARNLTAIAFFPYIIVLYQRTLYRLACSCDC